MKQVFLLLFFSMAALYSYEQSAQPSPSEKNSREALIQEQETLSGQIQHLQEQSQYYTAKAERLEEMGDRLQYQGHEEAAKVKWHEASKYETMSRQIDKEIAKLELEKQQIDAKLQKCCK